MHQRYLLWGLARNLTVAATARHQSLRGAHPLLLTTPGRNHFVTNTLAAPATTIDLRSIAPRERHALIFARFDALQPGQALELANDHDPRPLRAQFEDRVPGQYDWRYIESGPSSWRVRIGKTAAKPSMAGDSCCSGGACCG